MRVLKLMAPLTRAYPTTANYSLAGALLQVFGLFAPSNTFFPKCSFSFLGKVGVFVPATLKVTLNSMSSEPFRDC